MFELFCLFNLFYSCYFRSLSGLLYLYLSILRFRLHLESVILINLYPLFIQVAIIYSADVWQWVELFLAFVAWVVEFTSDCEKAEHSHNNLRQKWLPAAGIRSSSEIETNNNVQKVKKEEEKL